MGGSGGLRFTLGCLLALLLATAPGAVASTVVATTVVATTGVATTVVATTGTASAAGAAAASTDGPVLLQRVWAANFAGRAGHGLSPREWRYQTGSGIFGTGE